MIIYCVDIGSEKKKRFAWLSEDTSTGSKKKGETLLSLEKNLLSDIAKKRNVCIGFDLPMYFEIQKNSSDVTNKRSFEGAHPWSGGAGPYTLTTGLAQVTWLFQQLSVKSSEAEVHLLKDISTINKLKKSNNKSQIIIWEAFLSGKNKKPAKGSQHINDCKTGIQLFKKANKYNSLKVEEMDGDPKVYSFIGSILLRTGWTKDIDILKQPCIVIGGR